MKPRISDKQLRRFYRLLSVPMIGFDCGALCAPKNEGIPRCCENEYVVPILFREEFRWHRRNSDFWKKIRPASNIIRKFIEESESYYVFSSCPGPQGCRRNKRSLNCMTFPFEPHVDRQGEIMGLTFINDSLGSCPLARKPKKIFNPRYVENSIQFWSELFSIYTGEREMYIEESARRERRLRRQGKRLKLLTA